MMTLTVAFAREGALKGLLQKFAYSHTRPMLGHVVLGLTNPGELTQMFRA
jgi:hypothetical protein